MDIYQERIKPLFKSSGLTDSELEQAIGLPRSIIYDWDKGRSKGYKKYIDKIAKYFSISSDYLLGVEGSFDNMGQVIKKERERKSESIEDVAGFLDIDSDAVLKYEEDIYPLPTETLELIADHFGLTLSELIMRAKQCGTGALEFHGDRDFYTKLHDCANINYADGDTPNQSGKSVMAIVPSIIPVLGFIRAGMPILAEENIIGYELADINHPEEYFYLRVTGDSMINAGISDGSKVLIHKQNYAENGQIVACLVNGDEATLKRFKQVGDTVVLLPENPKYDPIIVPCSEFDTGYAMVLGVAKKVLFDL